jgi:hypothetical protein
MTSGSRSRRNRNDPNLPLTEFFADRPDRVTRREYVMNKTPSGKTEAMRPLGTVALPWYRGGRGWDQIMEVPGGAESAHIHTGDHTLGKTLISAASISARSLEASYRRSFEVETHRTLLPPYGNRTWTIKQISVRDHK